MTGKLFAINQGRILDSTHQIYMERIKGSTVEMNFIKYYEENKNTFIDRLKSMSHYAYLNYLDEKRNGFIIDEFLVDYNDGIVYTKKTGNNYGVVISFADDIVPIKKQILLYNKISSYLKDNSYDKIVLTTNSYNTALNKFLLSKKFYHKYSALELRYKVTLPYIYEGSTLDYLPYNDEQKTHFIELMGEAFEPMRKELDLKPYNWYEANKEEAGEYFSSQQKRGNVKGVWDKTNLVGVIIIENNEIEMLVIRKDCQCKGLGNDALGYLLNQFINVKGYDEIIIAVMAINKKAINLYKKNNFIEHSKISYLEKDN